MYVQQSGCHRIRSFERKNLKQTNIQRSSKSTNIPILDLLQLGEALFLVLLSSVEAYFVLEIMALAHQAAATYKLWRDTLPLTFFGHSSFPSDPIMAWKVAIVDPDHGLIGSTNPRGGDTMLPM